MYCELIISGNGGGNNPVLTFVDKIILIRVAGTALLHASSSNAYL